MKKELIIAGWGRKADEDLTQAARAACRGAGRIIMDCGGTDSPTRRALEGMFGREKVAAASGAGGLIKAIGEAFRRTDRVAYLCGGNPFTYESDTRETAAHFRSAGVRVQVLPGVSFLDSCFSLLDLDIQEDDPLLVTSPEGVLLSGAPLSTGISYFLTKIGHEKPGPRERVAFLRLLRASHGPAWPALLISSRNEGRARDRLKTVRAAGLFEAAEADNTFTVFIPSARLRAPGASGAGARRARRPRERG